MNSMSKRKLYLEVLIILLTIAISIILTIIFKDNWLGCTTLIVGFLNAYYMAIGKWYNYILGIAFSILYSYSCYLNHLYGFLIFTIIVYTPVQIYGLINWIRHKHTNEVEMKSLNFTKALVLVASLVGFSFILGYLLSLIPTQEMSFWDGSSQISNLFGIILVSFRYREAWYIWLLNNIIDLCIWIIRAVNGGENAYMMIVVSVMYLIMNIIGIVSWIIIEKKQHSSSTQINESNQLE